MTHEVSNFAEQAAWDRLISPGDAVVHLAARVHVMRDTSADAEAEYAAINVGITETLARAAVRSGAASFVFLSSVKVNGERTTDKPFSKEDAPQALDAYGRSKRDAERILIQQLTGNALNVSILRPPLVYGPAVKGNFLRLLKLVESGLPLPFAGVRNARSLLYVGNLVSAIERCIDAESPGIRTFLLSDSRDLSTPDLISLMASALGMTARLVFVPPSMLMALGMLTGRSGEVSRMVESLSVDSSKIRQQLQWSPPFTVEQGLDSTARWYVDAKRSH